MESEDVFGDLETVFDVVQAFITLGMIWQEIHPLWPAAYIGLKVCFSMKLFAHCEEKSRLVMIEWANRFLMANASRAASKKGPMSFERAYNLATKVCGDHQFAKEPPATRGLGVAATRSQAPRGGASRGGASKGHGGRGAASSGRLSHFGPILPSGEGICKFWNLGICKISGQAAASCSRDGKEFKHVCSFKKGGDTYCQGDHMRKDHV